MLSSLLHVMWIIPCAEKKGPQLFTVHKKGQPLTWLNCWTETFLTLQMLQLVFWAKTIEMTQGLVLQVA